MPIQIDDIEAFPLHWPIGYSRTDQRGRIKSPFKQTAEAAQRFLRRQIELLGAAGLIISSNILTRKDGYMNTDAMVRKIDDPGVAVYFRIGTMEDGYTCICCDQYLTVWENIYALGKTIESIRAIQRYGASEFIKRTFMGFKELPPSGSLDISSKSWWEVLEVKPNDSNDIIKSAFRAKLKLHNPDTGGDRELYEQVIKAFNESGKK